MVVSFNSLLFFVSLSQRWLFQYLCGQNLINERPPNGIRINIGNAMHSPVNGKTIPSRLRRHGLPKVIGKMAGKGFPQIAVGFQ